MSTTSVASAGRRRRARALGLVALSLLVVTLAGGAGPAQADGRCGDPASRPWCDPALPAEQRAALLLAQMTDQEKISLLGGDEKAGIIGLPGTHTGTSDGIERLGIPTIYLSDGPAGVRSGKATALPSPIAVGASFDPKTSVLDARVIADEVIRKGNDIVFAPTVDLIRTPLAGRAFEALGGEDPFLSSRLAVPWVKAAQAKGLIASVKHYVGNNQEGTGPEANTARPGDLSVSVGRLAPVGNRSRIDARIDERTLREMYLPMFEDVVRKADVGSVMCAYNKVNGPFACESRPLLEGILRKDWGFEGVTIADYGAVHDTGAALADGVDIEPWPGDLYGPAAVNESLASGSASMADVDRHVSRYLHTLFAHGAMDRAAFEPREETIDQASNAARSRQVAEKGLVLLKNDGVLPLDRRRVKRIAVVGPGAATYLSGGGSSAIDPFSTTTPLEGITRLAGPGVEVVTDDGSDPARAAAVAATADVAVVVAASYSTEGVDRTCLSFSCPALYGDQDALIRRVAAANSNAVVVMVSGGPMLTPWRGEVGALIEAWYPGSAGGSAIARVLFGKVDASGRLPVTFPRSESDVPTAGDENAYPGVNDIVDYDEGLFIGYRHYDKHRIAPAYPFGHGLSYTKFRFSKLRIHDGRLSRGSRPSRVSVSVEVKNTGKRKGVAVPQLYLALKATRAVPQPPKALKGFARVTLKPGRTKRVRFALDRRSFSFWNTRADRWKVVPGCSRVLIGTSSRKIKLRAPISVRGGCRPR